MNSIFEAEEMFFSSVFFAVVATVSQNAIAFMRFF